MKVIIAGSRDIEDYDLVCYAVATSKLDITTVISGTANGVDKLGERYATEHGIPIERYPADWQKHGKSAGYKRNQKMAEIADALIAVYDGVSRGTLHMVNIARDKKLKVFLMLTNRKYSCNYKG